MKDKLEKLRFIFYTIIIGSSFIVSGHYINKTFASGIIGQASNPAGETMRHAERVILKEFGQRVSIDSKDKDLLKFGRNENTGDATGGNQSSTIMTLPLNVFNETYVFDNLITHIASTDPADNQQIVIEGHTIDGLGNFTFVTQSITLSGQTKLALTTPLARATRAYNNGTTNLSGTIYISENVAFIAGVPQDPAKVHLMIRAGQNQSEKAATALSSKDYWIITGFYADVLEKANAFTTVSIQIRLKGKVFRDQAVISASNSSRSIFTFNPYFIVPPNSDIRLVATSSNPGTDVSGGIQGYLALVQ